MDWFTNVFLASFDQRFNTGKNDLFVTQKQAYVFKRYMTKSEYYSFYYVIVGDFQYSLVTLKNGTGHIVRELAAKAFH